MSDSGLLKRFETLTFGHRGLVIGFFAVVTLAMLYVLSPYGSTRLHIDASFKKMVPLHHEFMQTYVEHEKDFGGGNRILIALIARDGNMFTPDFFEALRIATDEVFFIPGVDRANVQSLWTPNVRYTEVVEDGIAADNVVPSDFSLTTEGLDQVRKNILKSGIVGRLVANDFSGAMISARLLEVNPDTGERLDLVDVSVQLEQKIRDKIEAYDVEIALESGFAGIDVHMIGFAKVIGDITEGAGMVVVFAAITVLITTILVFLYSQSLAITLAPVVCSLIAVIWQLGLLTLLGFGIDPMGILVPFLIFAIGVSHGVQMVSAIGAEIFSGCDCMQAARLSFRRLLIPGGVALLSDTVGFITILLIQVQVIQEMAITASLGVAVIILTNLFLLPVWISFLRLGDRYRDKLKNRTEALSAFWSALSQVANRRQARVIVGVALVLLLVGVWKGADIKIGDLHRGVPELRPESRYNIDTEVISDRFSIGVDIVTAIVETIPDGCIDYDIMTAIDEFAWHMANIEGVQSVIALPGIAKIISAQWNEGSLKWRVLSRNPTVLVQSVGYVETSSGLLNRDCSVMPVMMFTVDHKAETIDTIVAAVKDYRGKNVTENVHIRLATGNVGVMAATNEVVDATQFPILVGVFSVITLLCWLTFRQIRAVLCIIIPLGLVSLLAYALMTLLEIGLKVSTLPVVALGVGIGVDYGIYIFSRMTGYLKAGQPLAEAYRRTLNVTGNGVVFTGITLAIGVATWIFSPLKFQADMGILLTFMFLVNMLAAIFLLPALASWLIPQQPAEDRTG